MKNSKNSFTKVILCLSIMLISLANAELAEAQTKFDGTNISVTMISNTAGDSIGLKLANLPAGFSTNFCTLWKDPMNDPWCSSMNYPCQGYASVNSYTCLRYACIAWSGKIINNIFWIPKNTYAYGGGAFCGFNTDGINRWFWLHLFNVPGLYQTATQEASVYVMITPPIAPFQGCIQQSAGDTINVPVPVSVSSYGAKKKH